MINIKLILATNNNHKKQEFSRMLSPLGFSVHTPFDFGTKIDVEETGLTFEENATIKAKAVYDKFKCAVVSDDSGLEVDVLGGEPGIYSARYGGDGLSDKDRCKFLLNKLNDVPMNQRTARFICCICYINDNGDINLFTGKCEGKIAFEIKGDNGFGYDGIFLFEDKSFSQIEGEVKDRVSHRSNAMKKFVEFLNINK